MIPMRAPWEYVEMLQGMSVKTLNRRSPYAVDLVHNAGIRLRRVQGSASYIPRAAMDDAWVRLRSGGELQLPELSAIWQRRMRNTTRSRGSEFAALIACLPGVRYERGPILLFASDRFPRRFGLTARPEALPSSEVGIERS